MAAACLLVLLAPAASAHPEFAPLRSNRYVKVSLAPGAARLAYTVMIGERPAIAARKIADANSDGNVDEKEEREVGRALAAAVDAGLAIDLDGKRVRARWEAPVTGGFADRRVGPIPYSIDLVGRIDTGPGVHTLRLDDATPVDELGETEVRLEEGPSVKLLAAWHARDDGKVQTRFLWSGPKFSVIEDRSIGIRFEDATPKRRPVRLPIGLLGVLVGAGVSAYLVRRARKKNYRNMKG